MAKDRLIVCKFYTYAGGPCGKRGISAHMSDECQTCKFYTPAKNAKPKIRENKKDKLRKIYKKEAKDW